MQKLKHQYYFGKPPVRAFYTVAECAAVAKCSAVTIHRAIKSGKLKSFPPGGPNSNRLIPQGNLLAYIEGRQK